jgi:hypothetical protein
MKFIFDSEEEKEDFIKDRCPTDILKNLGDIECDGYEVYGVCEKCWENYGIEMEVKKDE